MVLSEDQAALLRLLLAGDTYERVAELLGTSVDEVRARAHRAAASLEAEPTGEFSAQAVTARLTELESGPDSGTSHAVPGAVANSTRPWRRWALWLAGGAAALVLVAVLAVVVAGGGDGDEGGVTRAADREDIVPVKMSPVGGSDASGTIAIVRVADRPAVDFAIRGLRPSGPGETYVLWFVGAGDRSLPVAFQAVGRDGELTGRAAIPAAAIGLLPSFQTAEITLTRQREAAAAIARAGQAGTLPQPVGATTLRGALR